MPRARTRHTARHGDVGRSTFISATVAGGGGWCGEGQLGAGLDGPEKRPVAMAVECGGAGPVTSEGRRRRRRRRRDELTPKSGPPLLPLGHSSETSVIHVFARAHLQAAANDCRKTRTRTWSLGMPALWFTGACSRQSSRPGTGGVEACVCVGSADLLLATDGTATNLAIERRPTAAAARGCVRTRACRH